MSHNIKDRLRSDLYSKQRIQPAQIAIGRSESVVVPSTSNMQVTILDGLFQSISFSRQLRSVRGYSDMYHRVSLTRLTNWMLLPVNPVVDEVINRTAVSEQVSGCPSRGCQPVASI